MNPQPLFYTGGALPPEYPYYVLRQADHAARRAMDKGKLIYIVAPRQIGKTSLLKRLAIRLENQGWHCCFVDLATLRNLKRPRWYRHLGEMVAHACGIDVILSPLEDQQDFRKFLLNDVGLGWSFNPSKVALFLDEVEGLLGLDFSDEFLMTLRDLYQQRDSYPGQLLIAFAGSVDPVILVEDSNISPFNIAEEIVVDDFALDESLTLTSNLAKMEIPVAEATHNRIYWWAGGQPHLTQRICEIIEGWVETRKVPSVSTDVVDRAVGTRLLASRSRDKNIKHVLGEIADLKPFSAELWKRLLAGEPVYSTETGFYALYLTGAVTEAPDGRVKIRNRIYERALIEIEVQPVPKPPGAPQPQDGFRYDAFISYSHKDSAWVRGTLLPYLEREGLQVCIDYRDFEPGVPSLINMENAIQRSRKTLIILTPDWVESEGTTFESLLVQTNDPAGRRARMIPLLLKPCDLPGRIAMLTYLDFAQPSEFDFQIQRLVAAISSARNHKRIRTKVRIFLASPGDVLDERNRLVRVVEELNRGVADWLGLTLELLRWEYIAPDTGRPQVVVFEQLPPEEWDIFVGVLWLRFGSETGELDPDTNQPYRSGTEEEFKAAYRRRQKSTTGWPKVMFYHCTRPPTDMLQFDAAQFTRVRQFFAEFAPTGAHPGLVQPYRQPEEFERLVREHLEKWLKEFSEALPEVVARPPAVPPAPTGTGAQPPTIPPAPTVTPLSPDEEKAMNLDKEIRHKQRLIEKHRARLAPLEEKEAIYGIDTPPHVITEIEEISRKIEALEREIAALEARRKLLPQKAPRRCQSRNPTVSR